MKKKIFAYSMCIVILILFFVAVHFLIKSPDNITVLSDDWDVEIDGTTYTNLSEKSFSSLMMNSFESGKTIKYSRVIGSDLSESKTPTLLLENNHCTLKMSIDGAILFDSSKDLAIDTSIGASFCFLTLPQEDLTKSVITIEQTAGDDFVYRKPLPLMIGDHFDLLSNMICIFEYPIFVCLFLTMFGGIITFLSLIFYPFYERIHILLFSGIFMISLGLWSACDYHFLTFVSSLDLASVLQYTMLFVAVGSIFLILDSIYVFSRKIRIPILSTGYGLIVFALLSLLLDNAGIVHQKDFELYYAIFFSLAMVLLFYVDVVQLYRKKSSKNMAITLVTLTIFLVFWAGNIIVTRYLTGTDLGTNPFLTKLFCLGATVYILGQIINYISFMSDTGHRREKTQSLSKIAYTDVLTGLNNRASLVQKIAEIDRSKHDYCVISLDLNGLKEVNDQRDHTAGDKLLKDVAHILDITFSRVGYTARIGGDEFVVIIADTDVIKVDALITQMNLLLEKLDEQEPTVNHSVAYGYAFRSECRKPPFNFHHTFLIADERMYATKDIQHIILKNSK